MPALAGEHDGVAAADVLALDAELGRLRGRAQVVHDVGVALAGGEHEGRLVIFIEADARALVAELEQQGDDGEMSQCAGQVQRRVGEAERGVVGVVEERGVRFEDAVAEEGVGGVDCAAEAEGGVDPVAREG